MAKKVADRLAPVLRELLGADLPYRLRAWDGSEVGPADATATIVLKSRRALRTMLWCPDELGLCRAYVAGDLDIEGDLYSALDSPELVEQLAGNEGLTLTTKQKLSALGTLVRIGALGRKPSLPAEELVRARRLRQRHDQDSDAASISHHYDVGNEFYELILGESMVYSCAYWAQPPSADYGLDDAQRDKLDLICRKLDLQPGQRLLDVGCGWGGLVLHAAQHYGVRAVGVTLSTEQAEFARKRIADAGLSDQIEIRLQDYRAVPDGPYDAVSSVGMAEHVGKKQLATYASALHALIVPGGRLLHHAIASPQDIEEKEVEIRSSFMDRYVFPDGEVESIGSTVSALDAAGFEIRDVENLREHYALTLREWVTRLEANWSRAATLTSEGRARVWRLYMVGCVIAFQTGDIAVNQTLAVARRDDGASGMPLTRAAWFTTSA